MSCRVKYNNKGSIEKVMTPKGKESELYNQLAKIPQISQQEALNVYAEQVVDYDVIKTKTGRSHMIVQGETKLGVLRTVKVNDTSETVDMVNVHQDYRGQGIGTNLYIETIRTVSEEGKTLKSDKHQTEYAKRIWENLVSQGIAEKIGESQYESVKNPILDEVEEAELLFNGKESLYEALNDGSNEVDVTNKGKVMFSFSSNTNPDTEVGFTNNLVKNGLVEDKAVIEDGEKFLVISGHSSTAQVMNQQVVEQFGWSTGNKINSTFDGRFKIEDLKTFRKFQGKTFSEIKKDLGEDLALIVGGIQAVYSELVLKRPNSKTFISSEETLRQQIFSMFEKTGFSIQSLEDYKKAYNIKNGEMPNVGALIDLANQVVAFKDGRIDTNVLSEEFSHFILEALPQEGLENLLRNVHRTQEYKDNYQAYFEAYKGDENLIRKEMLGKVLANGLQGKSVGISQNMFQKLWEMLQEFFLNVTPYHKEMQELTNKVSDLLITQDLSSLENITEKKFRMYSMQSSGNSFIDEGKAKANRVLDYLEAMNKKLKRSNADVKVLRETIERADEALLERSIFSILDLATRQTRYVEEAIADAHARQDIITQEERLVMINLKNTVLPALGGLSNASKNQGIQNEIKELSNRINRLPSEITPEITKRIVDRIVMSGNFPERVKINGKEVETKEFLTESLTEAVSDTNFVWSWFGQMSHTHDPLLNMTSMVISDMMSRANARYVNSAKNFQNKLQGDEKNLKRFTKNGYIDSLWDYAQLDKDLVQNEIEVLSEITNKTVTEENLKKVKEEGGYNENEFREKLAKKDRNLYERQFTDEYYEKIDKSLEGLSEITKSKMQQFFEDRRSILERVQRDSKDRPIFNRQDKINLEEFNRQRASAKSPFDYVGELKQGLEFSSVYLSGYEKVNNGYIGLKSNASSEAIIAFEMVQMDNKFFKEKSQEKLSKIVGKEVNDTNFEKELEGLNEKQKEEYYKSEIDGLSDEFVNNLTDADSFFANVRLSFVDSFWDSPLEDPLKEYVDTQADLDFLEKYDTYQKLLSRRKNILKEFQDSKNATNILGDRMSKSTQDEVRSLTDDITAMRDLLYKEADIKIDYTTLEDNDLAESGPNQSYWGWLKDNGFYGNQYQTFEQSMKHVPNSKKGRLDSIIYSLNAIKEQRVTTGLDEKRVMQEFGLTPKEVFNMSEEELMNLKIQATQKRLPAYFMSFAPKGLNEVLRRMEEPGADIKREVKELQKIESLKMTMHSSYYDLQDTRTINPNWIPGYNASRRQPAKKYISQEFINKYKPVKDAKGNFIFEDGVIKLPDTKDNNIYNAIVQYKKESLSNMGEVGKSNLYEMPQISRTKIDKISQIIKGKKGAVNIVKEWANEMISFRVDEQALGQEDEAGKVLLQSGERVVPKKYLRKLETKEDLSDDLFMTLTLLGKESELYKARTESLSEIMALEDSFLNRKTYNGKKQEATNSYRMLKSYIDNNIFGVTEAVNHRVDLPFIGTVDLAKLAKVFHKYLRNKNLAYNLIIPATSWLTAEAQIKIEQLVGQYLDKDSVRFANKELAKYSTSALTESLSINKTSKLSILGSRFGQFDFDKAFENSKYGSTLRTLGKVAYVAHTAGNFTPVMKAMLTGLAGHRIKINASGTGRFVDFNTFKYESKLESKSDKEIKAEWDSLRDKSFYSYLSVSDKGEYKVDESRMLQDLGNPDDFNLNAVEDMIGNKIRKFVERIDGNIRPEERTLLQRHFLGQYLMTHKGWLSIATANRFKAEHLNMLTGQVEEGTYRTVGKKLKDTVTELFANRKDMEAFKKTFSEIWINSSPSERTNLKRAMIEVGFISALYTLVLAFTQFADDDEQKDIWATQLSALLMERLVNETKSSQLGIFSELSNTVQEPVVGYKNILQTLDIRSLFSDEEVKRGTYAGLKEWQSYLIKNTVGLKPTYTIWSGENLNTQRRNYRFFNDIEELQPASVFLNRDTFK